MATVVAMETMVTMATTGVKNLPNSTGNLGKSTNSNLSNLEPFTIAVLTIGSLMVAVAVAGIVFIAALFICVRSSRQKRTFEQPSGAGQAGTTNLEVRRSHPLNTTVPIENHYVSCPEHAAESQSVLHPTFEQIASTSSVALVDGESLSSDRWPHHPADARSQQQRSEAYQELSWSHQQLQGVRGNRVG